MVLAVSCGLFFFSRSVFFVVFATSAWSALEEEDDGKRKKKKKSFSFFFPSLLSNNASKWGVVSQLPLRKEKGKHASPRPICKEITITLPLFF